MKIIYKFMTNEDIDDIFNISSLCFSSPWSKDSIDGELNNPLAKYIVAKDLNSNCIIGFIGAWIIAGEADITNIAVHPSYRQLGIGSKLLSYFINLCTDLNCYSINLEVRTSNILAQSLYKKFNFSSVGIRKRYYDNKEDAILMSYSFIKNKPS